MCDEISNAIGVQIKSKPFGICYDQLAIGVEKNDGRHKVYEDGRQEKSNVY